MSIAQVKSADIVIEDHGLLTMCADLSLEGNSGQSIGLYTGSKMWKVTRLLMDVCGVHALHDCVGRYIKVSHNSEQLIDGIYPIMGKGGKKLSELNSDESR